jgi:hypothetical protein
MPKNQEAVNLLRQFADFSGTGIRGIARMRNLQSQAQELIGLIDKKPKTRTATGWLADELRKHNDKVFTGPELNALFEKISLDNLTKVLPYFSWHDLREQALDAKWVVVVPGVAAVRIAVPPASRRKTT